MKKILFLAIAAGFIFTSCKHDDEETNSIIGTWKPSSEKAISGKNGSVLYNDPSSSCYKKSTFEFKSNNTVVTNIYEENSSGACENYGTNTSSYSYDKGNKQLIVDGEKVEVVNLTHQELHFVVDYDDVDGDGVDDKIIFVLTR